jgi:predicted alpha/beta-hydrolase family hydrolase
MVQRLLILPGFSIKNKNWAEKTVTDLQPHFEARIWEWKHWGTGDNADFSAESEATHIITRFEGANTEKVYIIAKSIGTLVLSKIVQQSPNLFDKIILCGVPLNDLEKDDYQNYESLRQIESRAICFQNDKDPHGNFAQVSKFFEEENINIPVVKKIADNHDYCYSSDFISFLSA